ncbi:MAG TPA: Wzz/FepE/Etk N-terminal domain-containing protein [Patescibacteria group bacterium]|nr:Wzz/FepE/Etk N-terminal domain-containing protein [Patescibacteria group bacterium]
MFLKSSPWQELAKRWKLVAFVGALAAIATLVVTLFFPMEYRADAQVLIISKSRYGVDPYTTVKSAERVGENLIQVMKTNDFYNKVMRQPGYSIDQTKFVDLTENKKRDLWQETLAVSMVYGTGVLNISTFHTDSFQAQQLAGATADALVAKGWEYVGGDVMMKVVNDPVVTRWPVRPNIILNTVLGFIIGSIISAGLLIKRLYRV